MKFTTAYYLVLLYLTVMLKPLIPIISDAWSHEFNGLEHISLVHAKYGNNHLQKELADAGSDKEGNKKQHPVKTGDDVAVHVGQRECTCHFPLQLNNSDFLVFNPGKPMFVFISNQGPPPKVL